MSDVVHKAHRERLRARFLSRNGDAQSDRFLLELLLTYAIPRKHVQPIAQALLDRFETLEGVLSASKEEAKQIKGIGDISWILLKVVDHIRARDLTVKSPQVSETQASESIADDQLRLFNPTVLEGEADQRPQPEGEPQALQEPFQPLPEPGQSHPLVQEPREGSPAKPVSTSRQKTHAKRSKRKLQVSNGHFLEFDQLARLLYAVRERETEAKITFSFLEEETGMPLRQVQNRVSIGRALGLFHEKAIRLSDLGELVVLHDPFMETRATLEYLHFMGAGNRANLIWYEVFNTLLVHEAAMDYKGWIHYFRRQLAGAYSDYSLQKHLSAEIRFVVDAYLEKNFQRLEILQKAPDGRLFRPRYTDMEPIALCAMIYDFAARQDLHLMQVEEMARNPGSPAMVFGLDIGTLRQKIEMLHERDWLRYETTHNLDQVRLKTGLSALEFLAAHYEKRQPEAKNAS